MLKTISTESVYYLRGQETIVVLLVSLFFSIQSKAVWHSFLYPVQDQVFRIFPGNINENNLAWTYPHIAGILASFCSCFIVEKLGRLKTIFFSGIFPVLLTLIHLYALQESIVVSKILGTIFFCLDTHATTLYIIESLTPELRKIAISIFQIATINGYFLSACIHYFNQTNLLFNKYLILIPLTLSFIHIILLLIFHNFESPRFLTRKERSDINKLNKILNVFLTQKGILIFLDERDKRKSIESIKDNIVYFQPNLFACIIYLLGLLFGGDLLYQIYSAKLLVQLNFPNYSNIIINFLLLASSLLNVFAFESISQKKLICGGILICLLLKLMLFLSTMAEFNLLTFIIMVLHHFECSVTYLSCFLIYQTEVVPPIGYSIVATIFNLMHIFQLSVLPILNEKLMSFSGTLLIYITVSAFCTPIMFKTIVETNHKLIYCHKLNSIKKEQKRLEKMLKSKYSDTMSEDSEPLTSEKLDISISSNKAANNNNQQTFVLQLLSFRHEMMR